MIVDLLFLCDITNFLLDSIKIKDTENKFELLSLLDEIHSAMYEVADFSKVR